MLRLLVRLMGPVFAKEMVEVARRRRYYFNRVFYCTALLLAMFVVWEEYAGRTRWGYATPQRIMAEMAQTLFLAVSCVQYGAVYLFVPVFVCGTIAGEREGGTLDLLFTTQLNDRQIVLGKLGSRAAVMLLLILSALPVLSLVMLLGGIEPAALWRTQAATLAAIVYCAAHAVYFSTVAQSTFGALLRTYWWMGLWLAALPTMVLIVVAGFSRGPPPGALLAGLLCVNLPFQFTVAAAPQTYAFVTARAGAWVFPVSFMIPLAWSALLIGRAVVRLRRPPVHGARRLISLGRLTHALRRRSRGDASRPRERAERFVWYLPVRNPLWLRSRLTAVYDREGYLRRVQWGGYAVAAGFLLILGASEPRALEDDECAITFLGFTWAAMALLTTLVAGSGLVGDRRRGFLELVLAAPLDPQEIVGGGMLAAAEHLRRFLWLPVVLGLFFCVTGASSLAAVLCSWITAGLFCAVLLAMGTMCSLAARSAPQALVPTFLLGVLMCVATVLLIPIFEEAAGPVLWVGAAGFLVCTWTLVRRSTSAVTVGCHFMAVHLALTAAATCWTYDGRREEYPALAVNPGYWTMAPLEGAPYYRPRYNNGNPHWYRAAGRWYWALACYWAALAANLVWARWWMIRRFDRLVGRTLNGPDGAATGVTGALGDRERAPIDATIQI